MEKDLNELLNKSLDELDTLADAHSKNTEDISKAQADEDLAPGDVAEDEDTDSEQEPTDDDTPVESQSDEDSDEDSEPEENEEDEDEVEKSILSELNSNDSVKKALEVSDFLRDLVKGLDTVLIERTDVISKSINDKHAESNSILAKSIIGIAKGQKAVLETNAELLKSMRIMQKRINEIEKQPQVRKSVSNTNQVIQKSFEGQPATQTQSLTKSQASAKLMKSFEGGNQEVLNDILALDGTGNLDSISDAGKQVLGLL